MKQGVMLLILLVTLLGVSGDVLGQVNLDGLSTKTELKQIRDAVNDYIDGNHFPFRSNDIDWNQTLVTRDELDDKPGLEAQVHIVAEGFCGASACLNAIIMWRHGRATVVDMIADTVLSILDAKSHGMHDLEGHYYSYRWDGKAYQQYCTPENVCD